MNSNDQPGKFHGPAEVRFVRVLPGPIERVWDYLTDPVKRARWFAGGSMELRAGGKLRLTFRHKDLAPNEAPPPGYEAHHDPGTTMENVVTRCEPPRLLAFTFGSDGESEVTIELTPQGKDVQLVLTHRATGGDIPYMGEFGPGWHTHLTLLHAHLAGTPPPPFWALFLRHNAAYDQLRRAAWPT